MNTQSLRHICYALFAVLSLVFAWYYGIAWIAEGGNLINLPSFFIDSFHSGNAAAFLTIDIAIVWFVYMIWVVPDAIKIGLGARTGWLFLLLSFLGTCFAFPLYLIARERRQARIRAD